MAAVREEERLVVSGDRPDVVAYAELATSGINVEITSAFRMKTLWNRAVRDDEIPASFLSALQRNGQSPRSTPSLILTHDQQTSLPMLTPRSSSSLVPSHSTSPSYSSFSPSFSVSETAPSTLQP